LNMLPEDLCHSGSNKGPHPFPTTTLPQPPISLWPSLSIWLQLIPDRSAVLSLPAPRCPPVALEEKDYESEGRRFESCRARPEGVGFGRKFKSSSVKVSFSSADPVGARPSLRIGSVFVNADTEMSTSMQPLSSDTACPSEVVQLPCPSESRSTPAARNPGRLRARPARATPRRSAPRKRRGTVIFLLRL
jgi:hypothetical protein